jgi:hypothetical protein
MGTAKRWQFGLAIFLVSVLADGKFVLSELFAVTVADVALSKGPNRQTILEEGAKKEGKLLWYTTLIVNQASSL